METASPTVLITGATGKLGRVLALGFAAMGAGVALTSRSGQRAQELEKECLVRGARRATSVQVDLTDHTAAAAVTDQLSQVDLLPTILINNARDREYLRLDPSGRTSRENWEGELLLGVVLPYELTMTLGNLDPTPLKAVINIASMYGVVAPNLALYDHPELEAPMNYGVSKAALIHLTRELAVRLAPRGIRVNAVSYGGISGRVGQDFQARYGRLCPSGRMLDETEVFGAVKFLASADAAGMTGHNLVVDGGWTIW
jgi:NAD(P)-dependent dehydrogenase (short-subunit alcohol dehydrogenase family)